MLFQHPHELYSTQPSMTKASRANGRAIGHKVLAVSFIRGSQNPLTIKPVKLSTPVSARKFNRLMIAHHRWVDGWIIVALTFMKQKTDADFWFQELTESFWLIWWQSAQPVCLFLWIPVPWNLQAVAFHMLDTESNKNGTERARESAWTRSPPMFLSLIWCVAKTGRNLWTKKETLSICWPSLFTQAQWIKQNAGCPARFHCFREIESNLGNYGRWSLSYPDCPVQKTSDNDVSC